jgi:ABC transport system ATP-binding/permease protein
MGHGVPELVLALNGNTWTLDASRSYALGRDPQGDVVLDDARVSWRHATIRRGERGWLVEDLGSTNGTFAQGRRVRSCEVGPGSAVHLGNADNGPRLDFTAAPAAAQQPQPAPAQPVPA